MTVCQTIFLVVPRAEPEEEDKDGQAEQADSSVFPRVICGFL